MGGLQDDARGFLRGEYRLGFGLLCGEIGDAVRDDDEAAPGDDVRGDITVCGAEVPFGPDLPFGAADLPGFVLHVEICEDMFVPVPPSAQAALAGATVLANLSGFDGSPESMRKLQLEYGAEIGRAIVNFDGPIAFCVISRYHGGAFVVFSKTLNPRMTVLAVDGSFASVLGGAPAAAAVFGGEVSHRTAADPRVQELRTRTENAEGAERTLLEADLEDMRSSVRAEKLGEVAAEFDKIHSIRRAVEVGSVDAVIPAAELRPRIIAALGD